MEKFFQNPFVVVIMTYALTVLFVHKSWYVFQIVTLG